MLYTIKNGVITVKISDLGAELSSVVRDDGKFEYIWQGDKTHWDGHSPWLFPTCSNLYGAKYTYGGKTYSMGIHGFAKSSTFDVENLTDSSVTFVLKENAETLKMYPFNFLLSINYTLNQNKLEISVNIKNTGDKILPATLGAHPGFNLPMGGNGSFEDSYVEFYNCYPDEIVLSENLFNSGKKRNYPLRDGKYLDLKHSLFAVDGTFLSNVSDKVTLRTKGGDRSVTVKFEKTPYLGIWSTAANDSAFVCLEPWNGLPSYDGITDNFESKNDMFRIQVGKSESRFFEYTFD